MKRLILTLGAIVPLGAGLVAYHATGATWPNAPIVMQLHLGTQPPPASFIDGADSWNRSVETALANWNQYMSGARFIAVRDSATDVARSNGLNNVFWSSTFDGEPFGERTLAIAEWSVVGDRMIEGDVIFNTAWSWNSYRGARRSQPVLPFNSLVDIQRVALHEFGHILGLHHPDEYSQTVTAIMNGTISDLDHLADDDIAGVFKLYPPGQGQAPASAAGLPVPGAPGSLTATSNGSNFSLTWTAPTTGGNVTGYLVDVGSAPGLTDITSVVVNTPRTTLSGTGVGPDTYHLRLRATNSFGAGPPSNEAILIVGPGCNAAPGAPAALTVSSQIGSTVTLAWNPSSGHPTTYVLEAGSVPGGSDLVHADLASAAPGLVAAGVKPGAYYVRLRARNACGTSTVSNEIAIGV